jgi:hypothetical protein
VERGGAAGGCPFGGRRLRLGMKSWFFVEVKSCLFGGGREIGASGGGKKESFYRGSLLGLIVHRLVGLEGGNVLRNPGVEEFVKSFREWSKACIVWRGGNKAGQLLEVVVLREAGEGWSCSLRAVYGGAGVVFLGS